MPKVSIVSPVYNAENYLDAAINSVKEQTFTDWELIFVDDCSGDGSRELIKAAAGEDPRIKLICQPENKGAAAARNRGVDEALGRYIAYMDSDDIWRPEKLKSQLDYLERLRAEAGDQSYGDPPPGFIFTGYEFADCDGKGLGVVVRVPSVLIYEKALGNTTIFTSTVLFDKRVIPKDLIKMPQVKSEDTACWWRILRSGHKAYGLDENLVLYRRTRGTLSSNKLEAIKRIWYLYRKVEGLSLPRSMYHFSLYAVRAVLRRV